MQVQDGKTYQGKKDAQDIPKEEEQQVMQTLVNLPSANTPPKIL